MNIIYAIFMIAISIGALTWAGLTLSRTSAFRHLKRLMGPKPLNLSSARAEEHAETSRLIYQDMDETVRQLLDSLNCKYSINEDEGKNGSKRFYFTYQDGHFILIIKKNSLLADLLFMGIYSGKNVNLPLIRGLCNSINCTVNQEYLIYRLQAEQGEVSVDIVSSLLLNRSYPDLKHYFSASLSNCFKLRSVFMENFDRLSENVGSTGSFDLEKTIVDKQHEQFLHHALEFKLSHAQHTVAGPGIGGITVGRLMNDFLQLPHPGLQRLALTSDKLETITNTDEIATYDLLQTIIDDSEKGHPIVRKSAEYGVNATLTYTPTEEPQSPVRTVNFFLQPDSITKEAIFIRITITEPALPLSGNVDADSAPGEAEARTFLVAYDVHDAKQKLSEFEYMFSDAEQKKHAGNLKELTEEQRYIMDLSSPEAARHAYWGKVYLSSERYYEAYVHLRNAWEILNDDFRALSDDERDSFVSITYDLGFCCNELGFYHSAYYYLDSLSNFKNHELIEEYIIALCNNHDFRAYYFINACLEQTMQTEDEEDEEMPSESRDFYNFLRRRMAWICVDQGYYDEAQNILNEMLTEPNNSDFALTELAYIQKMKNEEKADSKPDSSKPKDKNSF